MSITNRRCLPQCSRWGLRRAETGSWLLCPCTSKPAHLLPRRSNRCKPDAYLWAQDSRPLVAPPAGAGQPGCGLSSWTTHSPLHGPGTWSGIQVHRIDDAHDSGIDGRVFAAFGHALPASRDPDHRLPESRAHRIHRDDVTGLVLAIRTHRLQDQKRFTVEAT